MKKALRSRQAKGVTKSGEFLVEESKKRSSPTSPSLKRLRKLGHPYGKSHGMGIDGSVLPHIKWYVHRRKRIKVGKNKWKHIPESKSYRGQIYGYLRFKKGNPTYTVRYKKNSPDHVVWVVQGTEVMWPRDVIKHTSEMKKIRERRWEIMEEEMKKFPKSPFNPKQ